MIKITIDGKEYEVSEKKNLLDAVLSEKLNLQYFCYHPALGSVGACRQCAVKKFKDENDKKGRLVMACMEPLDDKSIYSINDPEAKEFREGIIEWLMVNHPHDCPVCDEGGECHLQDMTLMSGHNYRRYRFTKRTFHNQFLGPLINHEMNRCIECYRCVRYYRDFADGRDFNVFGIHDNIYFGRAEEGILENEFSGNLIEVCPTGVFTDKTLAKHYTRKWDLTNAPSICNHCSVGCNTIASERYGSLRRILTRYNSEVNGYFLCDRGRFGYEFVNSEKRIHFPLSRKSRKEKFTELPKNLAAAETASALQTGKTAGIGSPRTSLESNYALMKLVGKENFFSGVNKSEFELTQLVKDLMQNGTVKIPSLNEIENCEAVFIIGEDVTNTAPMTALALRQSSKLQAKLGAEKIKIPWWDDNAMRNFTQDARGPFYIAHPFPTKLDDISSGSFYMAPDDIARFSFAIANKLDSSSPAVNNMTNDENKSIQGIIDNIKGIKSSVVVTGISLGSKSVIQSAYNLALALNSSGISTAISFIVPECNSIGLSLLAEKSFTELSDNSGYDNVIILENDLYRREEKEKTDKLLSAFKKVIVIDHSFNKTTDMADLVMPAGTFAESDGTLISNEGRAQRFFQVYDASVFRNESMINESWRWIKFIGDHRINNGFSKLRVFNDFTEALVSEYPLLKDILNLTPPTGFRIAGEKIPREPHRFSGRTAMYADRSVNEPKPPVDIDTPLSFTMEGYNGEPPSSIIPFFWKPGWNSAQSIHKYLIEIGGPLHDGDPGKRLFEPKPGEGKYFTNIPERYSVKESRYLTLPVYHIFGSEEQSSHSEPITKLIPQPYILISKDDAENIKPGESLLKIKVNNKEITLKPVINSKIKKGIVGIPFGLPGMEFISLPNDALIEVSA